MTSKEPISSDNLTSLLSMLKCIQTTIFDLASCLGIDSKVIHVFPLSWMISILLLETVTKIFKFTQTREPIPESPQTMKNTYT